MNLRGCIVQRSLIATALAGIRTTGRAVTIVGGPGSGKTTLLDQAHDTARAARLTVLRCSGSRHDRANQLWHLHEAVYPLLDDLSLLPARQRIALSSSFDDPAGPEPDLASLRLAVRGLLQRAAARTPVVLLVDDWQWLDDSSADVLSFVAREVAGSAVVVLATSRTGPGPGTTTTLGPLDEREATELLDGLPYDLSPADRRRILECAAGNPLALVEYSAGAARGIGAGPTGPAPSGRLLRSFLDDVPALSPAARLMLLLCAAAGTRTTAGELLWAGRLVGAGPAETQELTRRGLVDLGGGSPVVRQPLLGAAVYADAPMTDRITVHRALARVSGDPLRAARHLAAGTPHQDGAVAAALERTARTARTEGALAEAVTVLKWSADRSPEVGIRAQRLADAAECARQSGQTTDRLLHEAYATAGDPSAVASLAITGAGDRSSRGAGAGDVRMLLALSRRSVQMDDGPGVAERLRLLAAAATLSATYAEPAEVVDTATAALTALDLGGWDPVRAASLAILDPARYGHGLRDRLDDLLRTAGDDPDLLMMWGRAAQAGHDPGRAVAVHEIAALLLRRAGRSADLAQELLCLALPRVLTGDLRRASEEAGEARRLAAALGLRAVEAEAEAALAVVRAWTGDRPQSGTVREHRRDLVRWPSTPTRQRWASGLTGLVQGRYRAAWIDLQPVAGHPVTDAWAVADLTEAAVLSGRGHLVTDRVAAAEAQARTLESDHLAALAHRARALLEAAPDAQRSYERSIAAADRAGTVLEQGRSHLAYGRWLRRGRRIATAREHLSTAMAVFRTAGARPWATLAQRELEAAGGRSARRSSAVTGCHQQLTPQERQIAELAADGLSNREIAGQLLLSHRTIGTHLYRVFAKLSITDRRQVGDALAGAR